MPELPEVETVRRDVEPHILNTKILDVIVYTPASVEPSEFQTMLIGNCIRAVKRKGKYLFFQLQTGQVLIVHLKMSGQLLLQKKGKRHGGGHSFTHEIEGLPHKHTRVEIVFEHGVRLFFNDMRRFGYMSVVDQTEAEHVLAGIGPDVYEEPVSSAWLVAGLQGRRSPIKSVLLDQTFVAGIGNIYADEMLHRAGILPSRVANSLGVCEVEALTTQLTTVIAEAVAERGTTFNKYVDGYGKQGGYKEKLRVYGRAGLACLSCEAGIITKTKQAGRGTHACLSCQH